MEPSKKNKPNALVVILFSLIVLSVLIYCILVLFFPSLITGIYSGEIQPTNPNE